MNIQPLILKSEGHSMWSIDLDSLETQLSLLSEYFNVLSPVDSLSELNTNSDAILLIQNNPYSAANKIYDFSPSIVEKVILFGNEPEDKYSYLEQFCFAGLIDDSSIRHWIRKRENLSYTGTRLFLVGYGMLGLLKYFKPGAFNADLLVARDDTQYGHYILKDETEKYNIALVLEEYINLIKNYVKDI